MWVKESLLATRQRRLNQRPYVFQVQISKSNLNKEQHNFLVNIFREAKWLYNYILTDIENKLNIAHKFKETVVKTPDWDKIKQLKYISSQIKQWVADKLRFSLQALKRLKDNWHIVWALKYKSEYNTLYLKQHNSTHTINKSKNRIKLQGCKKAFRVLWLHQIPNNAEIASAELRRVADWKYVFYITCFVDKQEVKDNKTKSVLKELYNISKDRAYLIPKNIGVDFGIKYAFILSNWFAFNIDIHETKRLKHLQKHYNRNRWKWWRFYNKKWARSNNRFWLKLKIRKEWYKIMNKKKDIKHRILAMFKLFGWVYIQDENVKAWHHNSKQGMSGKVQSTGIGEIIALLKNNSATLVVVDRYDATSQTCFNCGAKKKLRLKDRRYICDVCWYKNNRDVNASLNMMKFGWADMSKIYDKPDIERDVIYNHILKPNPYIRLTNLK